MKNSTHIQSVGRAVALLMEVAHRPEGQTASEAAGACGLAVPTAHHLLSTLAHEGLLAKGVERGRFVLGPKATALAELVNRQTSVPEHLMEPLRRLVAETGETGYLAAWRRGEIVTLGWIEGANALRVAEVERGRYRNPHARATGKLLLAYATDELRAAYLDGAPLVAVTRHTITDRAALESEFETIRARGWSEDHEEFLEGVACVSAPIFVDGVLLASLTLSSPAGRFASTSEQLREAIVRAAASVLPAAGEPVPVVVDS